MGGNMHEFLLNMIAMEKYFITFIIYCVVVILGHCCLSSLMEKLNYTYFPYENEKIEEKVIKYAKKQSGLLGMVERTLYLTAFLFDQFAFIGVWLTLKMVVTWKQWNKQNGRVPFNNFIIGNGINILYSFFGYLGIKYACTHFIVNPFAIPSFLWRLLVLLPYILTGAAILWCFCGLEEAKKKANDDGKVEITH
jgi:hypothetical protein